MVCGRRGPVRSVNHPAKATLIIASACLAIGVGCAPMLSTQRPAEVLEQGDVHLGLGLGVNVPISALARAYDGAQSAATAVASGEELGQQQIEDTLEASLLLATNSLLPTWDLQAAYGLWSGRAELDVRFTHSALRLGARFQVLDRAQAGVDLTLGAGFTTYQSVQGLGVLELVDMASSELWSVDLPVLFGWGGEFGHLWVGSKVVWSRQAFELRVDTGRLPLDATSGTSPRELASLEGDSVYVGGVIGGCLGYRYVWVSAELTVMRVVGSTSYHLGTDDMQLSGELDTGGWVVVPGVGLMSRF